MIEKITTGIIRGMPLMLGFNRFAASPMGELLHYTGIDATADTLRATVPPEGWDAYCLEYPDAQTVVDQLRLARSPAAGAAAPATMAAVAAAAIASGALKPPLV